MQYTQITLDVSTDTQVDHAKHTLLLPSFNKGKMQAVLMAIYCFTNTFNTMG